MKYLIIIALLTAAGCATVPDNPCSMANMTAAQLERAFVEGFSA